MQRISLGSNTFALVDDEDFVWLSEHTWHILTSKRSKTLYARRQLGTSTLLMHRLIMNAAPMLGMTVDHINGNGLDNRRCNLRWATSTEQQGNHFGSNNTSGYKGVTFHKNTGTWRAQIRIGEKIRHLGYYTSPEEAAKAYNHEAQKHFGIFATSTLEGK